MRRVDHVGGQVVGPFQVAPRQLVVKPVNLCKETMLSLVYVEGRPVEGHLVRAIAVELEEDREELQQRT